MREYIISYQAGTSPYWYNKSLYAESREEALRLFLARVDLCPYNVRTVKVREA